MDILDEKNDENIQNDNYTEPKIKIGFWYWATCLYIIIVLIVASKLFLKKFRYKTDEFYEAINFAAKEYDLDIDDYHVSYDKENKWVTYYLSDIKISFYQGICDKIKYFLENNKDNVLNNGYKITIDFQQDFDGRGHYYIEYSLKNYDFDGNLKPYFCTESISTKSDSSVTKRIFTGNSEICNYEITDWDGYGIRKTTPFTQYSYVISVNLAYNDCDSIQYVFDNEIENDTEWVMRNLYYNGEPYTIKRFAYDLNEDKRIYEDIDDKVYLYKNGELTGYTVESISQWYNDSPINARSYDIHKSVKLDNDLIVVYVKNPVKDEGMWMLKEDAEFFMADRNN